MSDQNLNNIKQMSLTENDFGNLVANSYFFKNQSPYEIALKESLIQIILEVRKLTIKYYGFYTDKYTIFNYLFFLKDRSKNYFYQNSDNNCFPLLTSLITKIYQNFGENKSESECNTYIKEKIYSYFHLDNEKPFYNKDELGAKFNFLMKYFVNTEINFGIEHNIESIVLENINKIDIKNHIIIDNAFKDVNEIDIINYVKKYFVNYNAFKNSYTLSRDLRMKLRFFFISYVSYELICELYNKNKKNGFDYKSLGELFYSSFDVYNKAIEGFNSIGEEIKNQKEKQEEYKKLKKIENNP
jgi:hypothetical protein